MKQFNLAHKRIVISRTDSIGDVMLTLPICAWIKAKFPSAHIVFLGKGYTKPVVTAYQKVDEYIDWAAIEKENPSEQLRSIEALNADVIVHVFPNKQIAKLAKRAKIAVRVGTSHRGFHLLSCNYRLNFTRKNSEFHEAQLNHELLRPFGLHQLPTLDEINRTTQFFSPYPVDLPDSISKALKSAENSTILHPKSQGSAREWPMEHYLALTELLLQQGHTVFFTGTAKEGALFRASLPKHERVIDTTGELSLEQLMVLIKSATNLVACSTGPLHIAGYSEIRAIGLFSPRRPIHPGRWRAIGTNVRILTFNDDCPTCAKGKDCDCITHISPERVMEQIA